MAQIRTALEGRLVELGEGQAPAAPMWAPAPEWAAALATQKRPIAACCYGGAALRWVAITFAPSERWRAIGQLVDDLLAWSAFGEEYGFSRVRFWRLEIVGQSVDTYAGEGVAARVTVENTRRGPRWTIDVMAELVNTRG